MNCRILVLLVLIVSQALRGICALLGPNLIQNCRFQTPYVPGNLMYFVGSIPGWNCTVYCQLKKQTVMSVDYQVLDISSGAIQNVSQIFQAQSIQTHIFDLEYYLPQIHADQKTLLIYLNEQLIYTYTPPINQSLNIYRFSTNVYPNLGSNTLRFTQSGLDDVHGFKLAAVSIQIVINETNSTIAANETNSTIAANETIQKGIDEISQKIISTLFNNQLVQGIVSFPAIRVLFRELINTFISFDRLQLYHYHNRNYSYYTNIFLNNISHILDFKSQLCLSFQLTLFKNLTQDKQQFIDGLDYKYKYIHLTVTDKTQKGYGFILNNEKLIFYSLPYFIVIILMLYGLFTITIQTRASRVFRKYSFAGLVFLLMICEGNIEQFSFYAFGEFTTFFSTNFKHKIVNCFIIFFFLLVVFCSTSLYLWCWSLHRNKIWCIVDDAKVNFGGMFYFTMDRGVFCLLFGAAHAFLIPSPNIQLAVLAICQILWICSQVTGLVNLKYKSQLLIWLNIVEGFFRIWFLFTNYLYTKIPGFPLQSSFLNESVHLRQIFLFIGIWTLRFVICLFLCLKQLLCYGKYTKKNKNNNKDVKRPKQESKTINFYLILKRGNKKKLKF